MTVSTYIDMVLFVIAKTFAICKCCRLWGCSKTRFPNSLFESFNEVIVPRFHGGGWSLIEGLECKLEQFRVWANGAPFFGCWEQTAVMQRGFGWWLCQISSVLPGMYLGSSNPSQPWVRWVSGGNINIKYSYPLLNRLVTACGRFIWCTNRSS